MTTMNFYLHHGTHCLSGHRSDMSTDVSLALRSPPKRNCGLAIQTTPRKLHIVAFYEWQNFSEFNLRNAFIPEDSSRNMAPIRPVRIGDKNDGTVGCDNLKYCQEKYIPDRPTKFTRGKERIVSVRKTDKTQTP